MDRALRAQAQVEAMLDAGSSFEHIEAYIQGRRDLTVQVSSALWLLAWAETDAAERRRVVRELVIDAAHARTRLSARARRTVLPSARR